MPQTGQRAMKSHRIPEDSPKPHRPPEEGSRAYVKNTGAKALNDALYFLSKDKIELKGRFNTGEAF